MKPYNLKTFIELKDENGDITKVSVICVMNEEENMIYIESHEFEPFTFKNIQYPTSMNIPEELNYKGVYQMNEDRDKFLTEAMGEHHHEVDPDSYQWRNIARCMTCYDRMDELTNNNFSTPDGFFKLWNWCQKRDWFDHFMWEKDPFRKQIDGLSGPSIKTWNIDPDHFANDLYRYLKGNNYERNGNL